MIARLLCLFGFHSWEGYEENYGKVPKLLRAILIHNSLMVHAYSKNGCYIEAWAKCVDCGKQRPCQWGEKLLPENQLSTPAKVSLNEKEKA